jgi:hypothetical protein
VDARTARATERVKAKLNAAAKKRSDAAAKHEARPRKKSAPKKSLHKRVTQPSRTKKKR